MKWVNPFEMRPAPKPATQWTTGPLCINFVFDIMRAQGKGHEGRVQGPRNGHGERPGDRSTQLSTALQLGSHPVQRPVSHRTRLSPTHRLGSPSNSTQLGSCAQRAAA